MKLAKDVIELLDDYIKTLGFQAVVHFELEGCYQTRTEHLKLNFSAINHQLERLNIDGELVPEYWRNQWEYVSKFNGQSPLKEAENLTKAIAVIPKLLAKQGIEKTLIQPVVWSGDQGKLAAGCHDIFTDGNRAVHIPNAVQINVSVLNQQGENIIPSDYFGEYLQQCFLETSFACSLIYLPEEDAFERFALKTKYGLAQELCSPNDISGGHQGSIALYKEFGKHNQQMGVEPLLYDHQHNVLTTEQNWRKTARIEHRLGASSVNYNAYFNVIFALANVIDALSVYQNKQCQSALMSENQERKLPHSLFSNEQDSGAIDLFTKDRWLMECINRVQELMKSKAIEQKSKDEKSYLVRPHLGESMHELILANYQKNIVLCESSIRL